VLSGAEFLTLVTGAAQITDVSGSADSNTDKTVDLHDHIVCIVYVIVIVIGSTCLLWRPNCGMLELFYE